MSRRTDTSPAPLAMRAPARRWLAPAAFSVSAVLLGMITLGLLRGQERVMAAGLQRTSAGRTDRAVRMSGRAALPRLRRPAKREAAEARPSRQAHSPSPLRRAPALMPATGLLYQLLPGERRVYRLSYTNRSESDFRALFAGRTGAASAPSGTAGGLTHAFRTSVEGEWVATVLDSQGGRIQVVSHVRQPTVSLWANGQEATVPANTLREELCRDVVVVTDRRGRVRSVRFDPAMSELSRNYARTLSSLTQCVRPGPSAAGPAGWSVEEEDPNGRYVAHYQAERNEHGDGSAVQTVRKTKVRYVQPRQRLQATDQQLRPAVLPRGSLVARFDRRRGLLLSLAGSESASMVIRGMTVGRSATGLRLQYVGQEKVAAVELAALRQAIDQQAGRTAAESLSATASREASEAAIQRRALGDATEESLLAELAKAKAEAARYTGPAPLYTPLYLKLKALIAVHPECCRRVGTLLTGADPNGVTASLLTGALSAVGHSQAQAALVEAIRGRPNDEATRSRGIAALAGVTRPTPLAEGAMRWEALHAPTRSARVMAEMALGTMARNLAAPASGSPARATRIVDELLRKLRASRSPEAIRLQLMALGNAGSVRALPAIVRYLAHRSPTLRASAAAALRWIDAPVVDARLTHCLLSDPDTAVRQEATAALGFREPTAATVATQQQAFRGERVEGVRLAILSNLGRAQRAFPQIQTLIRRAAAGDPSPNVRKAAATYK